VTWAGNAGGRRNWSANGKPEKLSQKQKIKGDDRSCAGNLQVPGGGGTSDGRRSWGADVR